MLSLIIPIFLTDILNPVLFAAMVFLASSQRPILFSTALLLGHTMCYFIAGIGLLFALHALNDFLANPGPFDFALQCALGIGLIIIAWPSAKSQAKQKEKTEQISTWSLSKAFGFGAILNLVGLPFAIPYIAAVDILLQNDLNFIENLFYIILYNIAYAAPFTLIPLLLLIYKDKITATLTRINEKIERVATYIIPPLFGLCGLLLSVDAFLFFFYGHTLF